MWKDGRQAQGKLMGCGSLYIPKNAHRPCSHMCVNNITCWWWLVVVKLATTGFFTWLDCTEPVLCSPVQFFLVCQFNYTGCSCGCTPKWKKNGPSQTFKHYSKLNPVAKCTPNCFTHQQCCIHKHEVQHGHNFNNLVPILVLSSQALCDICKGTISSMDTWFRQGNSGCWTGFSSAGVPRRRRSRIKLVEAMEVLKKMLDQWWEMDKLVKPYKIFFNEATGRLKEKVRKDRFVLLPWHDIYQLIIACISDPSAYSSCSPTPWTHSQSASSTSWTSSSTSHVSSQWLYKTGEEDHGKDASRSLSDAVGNGYQSHPDCQRDWNWKMHRFPKGNKQDLASTFMKLCPCSWPVVPDFRWWLGVGNWRMSAGIRTQMCMRMSRCKEERILWFVLGTDLHNIWTKELDLMCKLIYWLQKYLQ